MRNSIKNAISETVQDLINSGVKTSFTEKELNLLGVEIPEVHLSISQIKEIRKNLRLSQSVFARLLNVSPSSIRQWEQGKRKPPGSTQILLDLLNRSPHILDYRLTSKIQKNLTKCCTCHAGCHAFCSGTGKKACQLAQEGELERQIYPDIRIV